MNNLVFFVFFELFIASPVLYSLPLHKNVVHLSTIPTIDQLKFMQRFGYLDGGEAGFEAQYSEKSISEAIINIQRFGGIPQTGVIDSNTINLMRRRRCGVKDIIHIERRQKRYAVLEPGWKKQDITYFLTNWSPKLGEDGVSKEIKRALDLWGGYGNLTFRRIYEPTADIVIAFGEGYHGDPFPFDGPGNILAHAFFPYIVYGGNLHFDNEEDWTLAENSDNAEATNFFSVAIHEIGHTLGLQHSEIESSIMYPYYKTVTNNQLDYDDIMAMYELYIKTNNDRITEESGNNKYVETDDRIQESVTECSTTLRIDDIPYYESTTMPSTESYTIPEYTTQSIRKVTFLGDYETVDEHKSHDTKHGLPIENELPNICDGDYDAISVIRGELFVFKGMYVWRFKTRGKIEDGYPVLIKNMFPDLPIDRIDAAYERIDSILIFFSGINYWKYDGNTTIGPYSLKDYGVQTADSIKAVFIWKKNLKTYLFRRHEFWRFNEFSNKLDDDYPKNMTRWRGIPNDIDAAITWTDGSTYFFKGFYYWRFDNTLIKPDVHYPLPTVQYWFGCPENMEIMQQLNSHTRRYTYLHHH